MTTIAQGSTSTVTLGIGESVTVASNGGAWVAVITPVVGSPTTQNNPVEQHKTFGPLTGGGTVAITNQTVDTLVYVQTAAGVVAAAVITPVGSSSTFTLGDQGTLAVSNTNGYWTITTAPIIGPATFRVIGPQKSSHVFGPFPAGATITLANQTGSDLVSVATNNASPAFITGTIGGTNVLTANLLASAGTATTWQWTRNGTPISGQTASTYTQVPSTDSGTTIGVTINSVYTASVSIPAIAPVFSAAPTITAATATGVTFSAATLSNAGTPASTVTHDLYDNGSLSQANYVSGGTFTVGHTMTLIPYAVQGGVRVVTGPTSAGFVVTSVAPQVLRFASPTNYYPNSAFTQNLGTAGGLVQTECYQSQAFTIGQDMTSMTLGMTMQFLKATIGVCNVGNAISIVAMSVVYNGAFVAVKTSGAQSFTIADGANWLSDAMASTSFGGAVKFTKGTTATVKVHWTTTAASTDKFPVSRTRGTDVGFYADPTKITVNNDVYSTGLLSYSMANGGVNNTDAKFTNNLLPIFVLGVHTNPSVGFWGDSKTYGTGDTIALAKVVGMSRALFSNAADATTVLCSGLNMGCPSGYALECFTATGTGSVANHEFWYTMATYAVVGYGTNALITADQTTLYAHIRAKGIVPIIQRSLTPRTSSTDSWATTANQTASGGWGIGSTADNFEVFLRGNVSTDANFTYYQSTGERASPTLGTTDYWKFAVNGVANYCTSDGLHEGGSAPGYELNVGTPGTVTTQAGGTVAQSLRALVATLT